MNSYLSDKELIMLFDRRDEAALTELERKYGARLRKVAFDVLKNEADAEECVNDAFLKVWNSIPPAVPEKLSAYVESAVRPKAIDRYRTERRDKRIPPEELTTRTPAAASRAGLPRAADLRVKPCAFVEGAAASEVSAPLSAPLRELMMLFAAASSRAPRMVSLRDMSYCSLAGTNFSPVIISNASW